MNIRTRPATKKPKKKMAKTFGEMDVPHVSQTIHGTGIVPYVINTRYRVIKWCVEPTVNGPYMDGLGLEDFVDRRGVS